MSFPDLLQLIRRHQPLNSCLCWRHRNLCFLSTKRLLSACIHEVSSWLMFDRLQQNPSNSEMLNWCSSSLRQHHRGACYWMYCACAFNSIVPLARNSNCILITVLRYALCKIDWLTSMSCYTSFPARTVILLFLL